MKKGDQLDRLFCCPFILNCEANIIHIDTSCLKPTYNE
jgi:hypothetical protein